MTTPTPFEIEPLAAPTDITADACLVHTPAVLAVAAEVSLQTAEALETREYQISELSMYLGPVVVPEQSTCEQSPNSSSPQEVEPVAPPPRRQSAAGDSSPVAKGAGRLPIAQYVDAAVPRPVITTPKSPKDRAGSSTEDAVAKVVVRDVITTKELMRDEFAEAIAPPDYHVPSSREPGLYRTQERRAPKVEAEVDEPVDDYATPLVAQLLEKRPLVFFGLFLLASTCFYVITAFAEGEAVIDVPGGEESSVEAKAEEVVLQKAMKPPNRVISVENAAPPSAAIALKMPQFAPPAALDSTGTPLPSGAPDAAGAVQAEKAAMVADKLKLPVAEAPAPDVGAVAAAVQQTTTESQLPSAPTSGSSPVAAVPAPIVPPAVVREQSITPVSKPRSATALPTSVPSLGEMKLAKASEVAKLLGTAPVVVPPPRELARKAPALPDMTIYRFGRNEQFKVVLTPNHETDLVLEAGEQVLEQPSVGGNSANWLVYVVKSPRKDTAQWHVRVTPLRTNLSTTLTIDTDRRSYRLAIGSSNNGQYMAGVRWTYPLAARLARRERVLRQEEQQGNWADVIAPQRVRRDYDLFAVKGKPSWTPVAVFDDGYKTFIEFPRNIDGRLPSLAIVPRNGEKSAQYKRKDNFYVVAGLFKKARLSLSVPGRTTAEGRNLPPRTETVNVVWREEP